MHSPFLTTGAAPAGARLERIKRSPNYRNGEFQNSLPTEVMAPGNSWKLLERHLKSLDRVPTKPLPAVIRSAQEFDTPPQSGLRATWLGHSSVLLEIGGRRVLIDPVFAKRASPLEMMGPARFHPAPLTVNTLPRIDVVLITHDHYDHLDMSVIREFAASRDHEHVHFITSLGTGAHLEHWGIPAARITELDWWENITHEGLEFIACPARHFSGRMLKRNRAFWASFVIRSSEHTVFNGGDSGWFDGFAEIGERFGPFDLSIIAIGAYDDLWPTIHLNPAEAVRANIDLRGKVLLPVHWGTFNLGMHAWDEPIEQFVEAAASDGAMIVTPRPGESFEPSSPPRVDTWWRD